jgi:hypothetical protein
MIAKPNRDPLYHLADALSEDVVNMSDKELLAQVAEDFGEPRVLANEFNAIIATKTFDAKAQDLRRGPLQADKRRRVSATGPHKICFSAMLHNQLGLFSAALRWAAGIFAITVRLFAGVAA